MNNETNNLFCLKWRSDNGVVKTVVLDPETSRQYFVPLVCTKAEDFWVKPWTDMPRSNAYRDDLSREVLRFRFQDGCGCLNALWTAVNVELLWNGFSAPSNTGKWLSNEPDHGELPLQEGHAIHVKYVNWTTVKLVYTKYDFDRDGPSIHGDAVAAGHLENATASFIHLFRENKGQLAKIVQQLTQLQSQVQGLEDGQKRLMRRLEHNHDSKSLRNQHLQSHFTAPETGSIQGEVNESKPETGLANLDQSHRLQELTHTVQTLSAVAEAYHDLRGDLQCDICRGFLQRTMTLNCGHSFCNRCICTWKESKNECPSCRTRIVNLVKVITLDKMADKVSRNPTE